MANPDRTPTEQPPPLGRYLQPETLQFNLEQHEAYVQTAIIEYAGRAALQQFYDYRRKDRSLFNAPCWNYQDDSLLFWSVQSSVTPEPAELAIRLHHTVANSDASERSFSEMKLQHNKLRNRLELARVNKLVYIAMNARTLDYVKEIEDQEPMERKRSKN